MERTPISPDEAIQRGQVRRFLALLTAASVGWALAEAAAGFLFGSPRALATAVLVTSFAFWLAAFPRRIVTSASVAAVVTSVAVVMTGMVIATTLLQPFAAFATTMALLVPIAVALPYLEVRSLRRLMVLAWLATVSTAAAGFLPDDSAVPAAAKAPVGDEFAILLEDVSSRDGALAVARRAVGAVNATSEVAGQPVAVSASIGVAFRSASGDTVDAFVGEADAAMYEAKRTGKRRVVAFALGLRRP